MNNLLHPELLRMLQQQALIERSQALGGFGGNIQNGNVNFIGQGQASNNPYTDNPFLPIAGPQQQAQMFMQRNPNAFGGSGLTGGAITQSEMEVMRKLLGGGL